MLLLSFMLLWACGGDEEEMDPSSEVSLDAIADGDGRITTTGNAEATIDGTIVLNTTGTAEIEEILFNLVSYTLVGTTNSAFITIYWPASEGEMIPTGSYDVDFADASFEGAAPTSRFIQLSVVVDEIVYSSFIDTNGTATVTNVTSNNGLDLEFEVNNLEEFFAEVAINATGVLKYR